MFLCSLYVPCTLPCTFLVSIFVCSMFQYCSSPLCDRRKFCWTTLLAFYVHGVRGVHGVDQCWINFFSCLGSISSFIPSFIYRLSTAYLPYISHLPSLYLQCVVSTAICPSNVQGIKYQGIKLSWFIPLSIGVSLSGYQALSIYLSEYFD